MMNARASYDVDQKRDPLIEKYKAARELANSNPREAIKEMERLAFEGSILSILYVADALRTGRIYEEKHLELASGWYKVAIEAGSVRALHAQGLLLRDQGKYREAMEVMNAAIDRNYPPAMNSKAIMLYRGEGHPVDRSAARSLWKRAASLGHFPSSKNLAVAYIIGSFGFLRIPEGLFRYIASIFMLTSILRRDMYSDRLR